MGVPCHSLRFPAFGEKMVILSEPLEGFYMLQGIWNQPDEILSSRRDDFLNKWFLWKHSLELPPTIA